MPLLISSYSLKNESENMGQQESTGIHVKLGLNIDPELSHQMGPGLDMAQGLEGYSRDPGFHQNTVRDSGKRKIS